MSQIYPQIFSFSNPIFNFSLKQSFTLPLFQNAYLPNQLQSLMQILPYFPLRRLNTLIYTLPLKIIFTVFLFPFTSEYLQTI